MATEKVYKWPATMGGCADKLYKLREDRLAAQRKVDEMEAEEKALKEHIINTLPKSDSGAAGKLARVSVVNKVVPQVQDWDKFYAHVKKTGDFDLMNKALKASAVEERWANKKKVPGVGTFQVTTISINKL